MGDLRPERLEKLRRGGRTYGRTDVRTDGRKEIHPCVLQDIGPLGPLPKKQKTLTKTGKKRPNNPRKKSRHNTILIFLYCSKNGHNSFFVAVTVSEKKGDLV